MKRCQRAWENLAQMPRRGHGFAFQQISVPSPKQLCVYSTKELRVKGGGGGSVDLYPALDLNMHLCMSV